MVRGEGCGCDGFRMCPKHAPKGTAFQLPTDAEYDLDPEFTFIITCDGGRVSFTGREIFEILRRLRHEHDAAVERARKDALCARCGERPRIGDTHPGVNPLLCEPCWLALLGDKKPSGHCICPDGVSTLDAVPDRLVIGPGSVLLDGEDDGREYTGPEIDALGEVLRDTLGGGDEEGNDGQQ